MKFFLGFQSQQKTKYSLRKSLNLVDSKSLFFVEKSYINNKFLEIKIRLSSVEKMNYLRCLYREGDKVTRGTCVELTVQIPVTLALEFLRGTHVEQAL